VESNRQALDAEVVASKQGKIAELIIGQTLLGRVKVMLHRQSLENPQEKRCNAAIVTLPNGVDALLHHSDCSDGKMDDIGGLFKTGDVILVTVKGTDLDNGRVQLGYN
jgi:ribosomal protein S1